MVLNRNDRYVGRAIQDQGCWALRDIMRLNGILRRKLKSRETVTFFDVGSNIGAYTLPLAKAFGDRIRIRAFEAQSRMLDMLQQTLSLNAVTTVACHHAAVSDEDDIPITIRLPDYGQLNNFGGLELLETEYSDNRELTWSGHTEVVRTIRLDSFDESVDVIKIDVEGMEYRVLKGAVNVLARSRPVCQIEMLKTDPLAVTDLLRGLDYCGYRQSDELLAIPAEESWSFPDMEKLF